MLITITTVSILVISAVVWLVNKVAPFTVCPICAGVFLTWVGLVSVHLMGYTIDMIIPALLMGGSVIGITYQLEKKFARPSLLWKAFFIPAGFVAAYAILEQLWTVFLIAVVFLFLVSLSFSSSREKATDDIEKKMKECC